MNRKEFNEIVERFHRNEERLKSLVPGQKIYEDEGRDPLGGYYFEHHVVSIDLDKMIVNTKDMSQNGKLSYLHSFHLGSEINLPD